jgi:hypothetical protein
LLLASAREETLRHRKETELTTTIISDFADEATRIVEKAQERSIVMRLMGATVIRKHCPKFLHLHTAMKRELTDIDFMTCGKFNHSIRPLFIDR